MNIWIVKTNGGNCSQASCSAQSLTFVNNVIIYCQCSFELSWKLQEPPSVCMGSGVSLYYLMT